MLYKTIRSRLLPIHSTPLFLSYSLSIVYKARFKRRATAVSNSIDLIKFDFSTALAGRLKPSRATAM